MSYPVIVDFMTSIIGNGITMSKSEQEKFHLLENSKLALANLPLLDKFSRWPLLPMYVVFAMDQCLLLAVHLYIWPRCTIRHSIFLKLTKLRQFLSRAECSPLRKQHIPWSNPPIGITFRLGIAFEKVLQASLTEILRYHASVLKRYLSPSD